jgi:hypothetical protein
MILLELLAEVLDTSAKLLDMLANLWDLSLVSQLRLVWKKWLFSVTLRWGHVLKHCNLDYKMGLKICSSQGLWRLEVGLTVIASKRAVRV